MFKKIHVFRIKPQQELLAEIARYCNEHSIYSGLVLGIIGSVKRARLNFLVELPGKYVGVEFQGPLEIVCAQGSIALKNKEPIIHIHMLLSEKEYCHGGHLAEADIFSTAEVSIAEIDYQLNRYYDNYTGLNELLS